MKGEAICHGAATIVNAIALGKGAAFGIDLRTSAEVELIPDGEIEIIMEENENPSLAIRCFENVLSLFAPNEYLGAVIRTRSNIPISRGLKSSSAAANAIVLATLNALEVELDPLEAVKIGTKSAVEAGVSVTGAFDDATASLLGGVMVTDNEREMILKRDSLPDDIKVLLHIPDFKIRKRNLPLERIRSMAPIAKTALDLAIDGDYFWAMTLNGICFSAALGLDQELAMEAMYKGALAAGVSGTGPATAILVKEDVVDELLADLDSWELRVVELYQGDPA
jgi:shikimate kinase